MSIIKAYLLPHPPLAIPAIGKGSEKKIQATLDAFARVGQEIAEIAPDTILFITPHNTLYSDYFHISPGSGSTGNFADFGAPEVELTLSYDTELVKQISHVAHQVGLQAGVNGDRKPILDHGTMVPMWYINQYYADYRGVRISQSGLDSEEHYRLGMCIHKAVEQLGRKVVLIASGDLSHKLSEDGPYGYAMEGNLFDQTITTAMSYGDYRMLMLAAEKLREPAAECGYGSCVILAGCFDRTNVSSELYSYEGPFGVGYAIAGVTALDANPDRNFMQKLQKITLDNARQSQLEEDTYQVLARKSLEHYVKTGKKMKRPPHIVGELARNQAGVFVSLTINDKLRGCIGTINPTTSCIADEIIQNAISAGTEDTRFDPVTVEELDRLVYSVDVLLPAEDIESWNQLDPKKYGVIVSNGRRRGLLLPNLDGVDTVEQQLEIARRKAGIWDNEEVKIQRFEVIRHGHED